MIEFLSNESEAIHWYVWIVALAVLSQWESVAPRRSASMSLRHRWAGNLLLAAVGVFLVWLIAPVLCIAFARIVTARELGLLAVLDAPLWVNVVIGVMALDLGRYLLHWAAHKHPLLWRMHRVHHTDQDMDFTTSLRFHPIELGCNTVLFMAIILALGLHPITVLIAETLSLAINTFNHGNVRIASRIDRLLRRVVVTPDMHRVHHSSEPREFNANLGGLLSWWDRLFRTYVPQPTRGHEAMRIGLASHRAARCSTVLWMLSEPFLASRTSGTPIEHKDPRAARSVS